MNTKKHSYFAPLATLSLAFAPMLAHAHPGHGVHGFSSGLAHPVHGLDHVLAMIAVGIWAAQLGGRAKWLVPASFVSVMAIGGALGMAGVAMPFAEQGILASVLILGVLIAAAVRLPLAASMGIVGLFALCHGHAHGLEMPGTATGLAYGAGFVIATALLHATGIGAGLMIQRFAEVRWLRVTGLAICAASALLALN
jgi:urease accessory protein